MAEAQSFADSKYKFDDLKVTGRLEAATAYRSLAPGGFLLVKGLN